MIEKWAAEELQILHKQGVLYDATATPHDKKQFMMNLVDSFIMNYGPMGMEFDDLWRYSERWRERWVTQAQPEWIDILTAILIDAPKRLKPSSNEYDEEYMSQFSEFFFELAERFPDVALDAVQLLLSDDKMRSQTVALLFKR